MREGRRDLGGGAAPAGAWSIVVRLLAGGVILLGAVGLFSFSVVVVIAVASSTSAVSAGDVTVAEGPAVEPPGVAPEATPEPTPASTPAGAGGPEDHGQRVGQARGDETPGADVASADLEDPPAEAAPNLPDDGTAVEAQAIRAALDALLERGRGMDDLRWREDLSGNRRCIEEMGDIHRQARELQARAGAIRSLFLEAAAIDMMGCGSCRSPESAGDACDRVAGGLRDFDEQGRP